MYQHLDQSLLNIIYNSNFCNKYIDEINKFIQVLDVSKVVGEYIFPPIFDLRADVIKSFKDSCSIFGYVSEKQSARIKKLYDICKNDDFYKTQVHFFLNDNTSRHIYLNNINFDGGLFQFIVNNNKLTLEHLCLHKLNSDKDADMLEITTQTLIERIKYSTILYDFKYSEPIILEIDQVIKNDDYSIVYTNEIIFLMDNNRIHYN